MAVAMTADLNSTANFGLITASAILLALVADFFMVPALMYAVYARNVNRVSDNPVLVKDNVV